MLSLILLNRLPIPNLKQYFTLSLVLFLLVVLYAQKVLYNISHDHHFNDEFNSTYIQNNGYVYTVFKAVTGEPWCTWVLINCGYCVLLMCSKIVQRMVFGNLRVVEYQHIKDQFWNFIFLKFIFIFGVLNLENANEVGMWITWFSIIGFLAIHSQICKDRFEYLSFSSTTLLWSHIKVIALLNCIISVCMGLMGISIVIKFNFGFNIGLFMFTESFALTVRTVYVVAKYMIHLWDLYYVDQWENKGTVSYYVDFIFELTIIIVDFLHYIHMLLYGNFFLSMASIVICMELRRLFSDLKKRIKRHQNYLKVIDKMEKRFPWATKAELVDTDKCAVCWENMDKARRLPCSHIFHHNCLRSWLEQDTSCPTCRTTLQDEKERQLMQQQQQILQTQIQQQQQQQQDQAQAANQQQQQQALQAQVVPQAQPQNQNAILRRMQRNLFHFDGSRYISWLPSFSVEVTHNLGNNLPFLRQNIDENRLNAMAQQVIQVFPHVPINVVIEDLRQTHSAELTIENILQERVNAAQGMRAFETESELSSSDENSEDTDLSANMSRDMNVNNNEAAQGGAPSASASAQNSAQPKSEFAALFYERKRQLLESSKNRYLSRQINREDAKTDSEATETPTYSTDPQSILRHRNTAVDLAATGDDNSNSS